MKTNPLKLAVLILVSVVAFVIVCIMVIAVVDVIRYGGQFAPGAVAPAPVASSDPVERGAAIYKQRCAGCHSIDGSAKIGPTFKGLYGSEVPLEDGTTVVADEAYLHESIVDPSAQIVRGYPRAMPSFASLGDQQVDDLIAYIRSLT